MADEQPTTRDGLPITVGMKVAHFLDEWEGAGEVLFIDRTRWGWDVMYRGPHGDKREYSNDILYGSLAGLLAGKIEQARKTVLMHRERLLELDAEIDRLTKELAELEGR